MLLESNAPDRLSYLSPRRRFYCLLAPCVCRRAAMWSETGASGVRTSHLLAVAPVSLGCWRHGCHKRMHSTFLNSIKRSIEKNKNVSDENLKLINCAINTMENQRTGFSPFELTFGREPNIPYTITNSPTLTYQDYSKMEDITRKLHSEKQEKEYN